MGRCAEYEYFIALNTTTSSPIAKGGANKIVTYNYSARNAMDGSATRYLKQSECV